MSCAQTQSEDVRQPENPDAKYIYQAVERSLDGLPAGSTILDAGCGLGFMARALVSHGWQVHGVDVSESRLSDARAICPQATFAHADLSQRHTMTARYDAVVSVEVIEHIYAPDVFLSNLCAALKPGGRVVITTPYNGYWKNLAIALLGQHDKHVNPLWQGGHIKFWSHATLTTALLRAGFTDIQFSGVGRVAYLWKSMIATARKP